MTRVERERAERPFRRRARYQTTLKAQAGSLLMGAVNQASVLLAASISVASGDVAVAPARRIEIDAGCAAHKREDSARGGRTGVSEVGREIPSGYEQKLKKRCSLGGADL